MPRPDTDQHQGRVVIWERSDDSRSASDLTGQALNHIVGSDLRPMFRGKVTVGRAAQVSFSASASRSSFRVRSTLPRTNSLICSLIISSFNCPMLLDMVCCLRSECVCRNFILPETAGPVYFLLFSICAAYCVLSKPEGDLCLPCISITPLVRQYCLTSGVQFMLGVDRFVFCFLPFCANAAGRQVLQHTLLLGGFLQPPQKR